MARKDEERWYVREIRFADTFSYQKRISWKCCTVDAVTGSLLMGWETLASYVTQHVITCLVPAFFIAGGIAAFLNKEAILKYFSPEAKKTTAYGIASVSGTVLASAAVPSCPCSPVS
jgi:uncharacterized membrane protein YraQ (UPF0718 family)